VLLPYLAVLLSSGAFRDYDTIEQLLAITPSEEDGVIHIRWKDKLLEHPFFVAQSSKKKGKIEMHLRSVRDTRN
jgi:hypothetical protein